VAYSELQPLACTAREKLRKEASVMIDSGMTHSEDFISPRSISLKVYR